jgi:hypothetical protein
MILALSYIRKPGEQRAEPLRLTTKEALAEAYTHHTHADTHTLTLTHTYTHTHAHTRTHRHIHT